MGLWVEIVLILLAVGVVSWRVADLRAEMADEKRWHESEAAWWRAVIEGD